MALELMVVCFLNDVFLHWGFMRLLLHLLDVVTVLLRLLGRLTLLSLFPLTMLRLLSWLLLACLFLGLELLLSFSSTLITWSLAVRVNRRHFLLPLLVIVGSVAEFGVGILFNGGTLARGRIITVTVGRSSSLVVNGTVLGVQNSSIGLRTLTFSFTERAFKVLVTCRLNVSSLCKHSVDKIAPELVALFNLRSPSEPILKRVDVTFISVARRDLDFLPGKLLLLHHGFVMWVNLSVGAQFFGLGDNLGVVNLDGELWMREALRLNVRWFDWS